MKHLKNKPKLWFVLDFVFTLNFDSSAFGFFKSFKPSTDKQLQKIYSQNFQYFEQVLNQIQSI